MMVKRPGLQTYVTCQITQANGLEAACCEELDCSVNEPVASVEWRYDGCIDGKHGGPLKEKIDRSVSCTGRPGRAALS
ncbi:hypothetical protein EMIT0194P_100005 [Pseudomonas serbica]